MRTPFARVALVAFAVVHVALALDSRPTPVALTVLALSGIVGAAAVVVLAPDSTLSSGLTVVVVLLAAGGVALVVPALPTDGWPGYASWPLGAATFVAIGLTLRRRIGAAWITMGAMTGLCLIWSVRGGAGAASGLGLVDRQIGVLLIGTLFAVGLRRAARLHDELAATQRQEGLDRDLADAELQARRHAVQQVLAEAGPMLERIAAGSTFDEEERGRIIALEGSLRDEITLASLLSESLDRALTAARRRGVDVVVLTEPSVEALSSSVRRRAADWLAARIERAHGGGFVGRVVLSGDGARVSATVDEGIEDRHLADADADA